MKKENNNAGRICIDEVLILQNKIKINYRVDGEIKKYFYDIGSFDIEYSINIENLPKSIAIVPFVTNVLPLIWITDSVLEINELDADFYSCIGDLKTGYINMYPQLDFEGKIRVKEVIKNDRSTVDKVAVFFSGGVDAFSTLISHIDETPELFTLWGNDILYDNQSGWKNVEKHIEKTAEQFNLNFIYAKTNFRCFLREESLNKLVKIVNDSWWHGFQHGIGLIGHAAPYVYINKINHIYIASTYTIKDKGKVTCASDPTIDNYVRFCDCKVTHDQYELSRQDKLENICSFAKREKQDIELRVCYQSHIGYNCCNCEKCYRTILGLLAEKVDPQKFGFTYSKDKLRNIVEDIKREMIIPKSCIPLWKDIQLKFLQNMNHWRDDEDLNWILYVDFDQINSTVFKKQKILMNKIKANIKYLIHWESLKMKFRLIRKW